MENAQTTFPPPSDIVSRFEELGESVISRQINWLELLPYLVEQDLVDHEDQGGFLEDGCSLANGSFPKLTVLEECLRKRGRRAYTKFLQCTRSAKQHLGHAYVAAILEGREFTSEEDIGTSQMLKNRITDNMTRMMDINLSELVPLLLSSELVTKEESETLLNENKSTKSRIKFLFDILDTKGPTAHLLFVQCLNQEHTHPTHSELYDKLTSEIPVSRKRRSEVEDVEKDHVVQIDKKNTLVLRPPKRSPTRLKMEGPLLSEEYESLMGELKSCLQNCQWTKLDLKVTEVKNGGVLELHVVALLEVGLSWIYRTEDSRLDPAYEEDRVTNYVETARALCSREEICGDNACFLEARCDYILANLYRNLKQYAKAREYSDSAKSALYVAMPGVDSSTACYTDACIQMESPDRKCNTKHVEVLYKQAADDAEHCDGGNMAIAFHARMHLAQLCLGTSLHKPGTVTDRSSISRARDCLIWIEGRLSGMSERSACLFHIVNSDCYRNEGNQSKAIEQARLAQEMAIKCGFFLVGPAEIRLKELGELDDD